MLERRQFVRNRVLFGGVVAFNNRYSTMNCTVRNFSGHGAKLCLDNVAAIPEEFDLAVAQKQRTFRARIIWRDADNVGVTFVESPERAPVSLDLARQLRDAKATNIALRKRISDLSSS